MIIFKNNIYIGLFASCINTGVMCLTLSVILNMFSFDIFVDIPSPHFMLKEFNFDKVMKPWPFVRTLGGPPKLNGLVFYKRKKTKAVRLICRGWNDFWVWTRQGSQIFFKRKYYVRWFDFVILSSKLVSPMNIFNTLQCCLKSSEI